MPHSRGLQVSKPAFARLQTPKSCSQNERPFQPKPRAVSASLSQKRKPKHPNSQEPHRHRKSKTVLNADSEPEPEPKQKSAEPSSKPQAFINNPEEPLMFWACQDGGRMKPRRPPTSPQSVARTGPGLSRAEAVVSFCCHELYFENWFLKAYVEFGACCGVGVGLSVFVRPVCH